MEDSTQVTTERKFLLFQLDFYNPGLESHLIPRWDQEKYPNGRPDLAIGVSDYSDYDNVLTEIYWRNRLVTGWKDKFDTAFKSFSADIYSAINKGFIRLRRLNSQNLRPYIDISPYIRSVSGYSVSLGDFSNAISLSIGRPDHIGQANSAASPGPQLNDPFTVFNKVQPRENDVLMVMVKYPGKEYEMEYLGLVDKVTQGAAYGSADTYGISVDGISNLMKVSDIIKQHSVSNDQFIPNIEVNQKEFVSVFADQFNDKDIEGIFTKILDSVLSIGGSLGSSKVQGPASPYTRGYTLDPDFFVPKIIKGADGKADNVEFKGGGFQHNFFVLLTLFLMTIETTNGDAILGPADPNATVTEDPYFPH